MVIVTFLLASAMVQASVPDDAPDTGWLYLPRVMECAPKELGENGTLLVQFGKHEASELAIRRADDNVWYMLVAEMPLEGMVSLMTPAELATTKSLEIPSRASGFALVAGRGMERIFTKPGVYEVFLSEAIESDIGGYMCSIRYSTSGADG